MVISTPWAILLCKFNDNTSEPHPRKFYEDLFTDATIGNQNMVNFFRDMSHGTLDLTGSKIFGWYTLKATYPDYQYAFNEYANMYADIAKNPNAGRVLLTDWALEAAKDVKDELLKKFSGIVVVYNTAVDLFGYIGVSYLGVMAAVCDEYCVRPSLLGQEMGHGYGLDHSRVQGSKADYQDPWDIMSTRAASSARHPTYDAIGSPALRDYGLSIGPGLNAATMAHTKTDGRVWLDDSQVWNMDGGTAVVDLRPLHRLDLRGSHAISVDKFFIEFRMNEGWDAAFPSPVVLIHYFEDNHSYIVPDTKGNYGLTKGSIFGIEEKEGYTAFYDHLRIRVTDIDGKERIASLPIEYLSSPPSLKIEVLDIDAGKRTARISIENRLRSRPLEFRPTLPEGWKFTWLPGGIPLTRLDPAKDIVIVNEKIIRTPQWSLMPVLKSLADICSSEQFDNVDIRRTIRQESLETIIKIAKKELVEMKDPGGVAPPRDLDEQSQQPT